MHIMLLRSAGLIGLVFAIGCSSDGKVTVNGTVYLDDKPMDGGTIAFVGRSGGVLSSASTDAQGKFKILAEPGKNQVAVSKADPKSTASYSDPKQGMPSDAEYAQVQKKLPPPLVAARFSDPEKSGIAFDVTSGMQPVEIRVTFK